MSYAPKLRSWCRWPGLVLAIDLCQFAVQADQILDRSAFRESRAARPSCCGGPGCCGGPILAENADIRRYNAIDDRRRAPCRCSVQCAADCR
jgi:hypothetical protein